MSKDSFLNRNFLLLTQGQLVNQAGTQIALAATAYWLKQSTNSASLVGLMSSVSALPLLLLSPLGGAVADRWSRRNVLIISDILCGVVSCALALLMRQGTSHLAALTAGLFLGNLILSSAIAFTNPALNALIPSLVATAQIGAAMAFAQASGFLSMILGQFLGGMLLTRYLPAILYWVDAVTYFVSAAAESLVRVSTEVVPASPQPHHSIFHDVREGFSYVWRRAGMRALLLAAIPLNVLTTPVFMLLPFYATNTLHQPLGRFGYLLAALSVGILTGYAVGGKFHPAPGQRHRVVFGCVLGCAVAILALASFSILWPAVIALATLGTLIGVVTLVSLNAFILQTEPERRGTVAAVLLMVTQGLTPLTLSLIGVVSDLLGDNIRLIYGGCSVLLLSSAFALFSNRDLREFLHYSGSE